MHNNKQLTAENLYTAPNTSLLATTIIKQMHFQLLIKVVLVVVVVVEAVVVAVAVMCIIAVVW